MQPLQLTLVQELQTEQHIALDSEEYGSQYAGLTACTCCLRAANSLYFPAFKVWYGDRLRTGALAATNK